MAISDATCTVGTSTQPVASSDVTDVEPDPEPDRVPEPGAPTGPDPALDTGRHSALDRLEDLAGDRPVKVNRFDRPPEPHDWRWVVGGVGRTFIAVGVLMFAFVAYQLWGTGIQTAAAQDRLAREFDELLAAQATVATTVAPTTLPPTTVPTTVGSAPTTVAPATTAAPTTVPPPAITPPAEGEPVARLQIDTIGLDWSVVEGVRAKDLADGPGHFPETPLPGQLGNSALAGHRTTHGQPFNRIDELEVGDDIVVTTLAGRFVYVVTGERIVSPDDYASVIPTVDPTRATLTLTSCHPKFSTSKRYVVDAELDLTRSSQVTAPVAELPPPSEDQPIDTSFVPTTVADSVAPIGSAPSTDVSATDVPATDVSGTGVPVATPDTNPAVAPSTPTTAPLAAIDTERSEGVFQNSWFADDAAWVDVGLWGMVLTAISIGSWLLSRRVKRNWVGALVGIAPFVVVLYFWFENVNRLLPANL
jgi:sortase A